MTDTGRGGLDDAPFAWREGAGGKVFITWRGRQVTILKDEAAQSFLRRVPDLDAVGQQLALARLTGNFKRGNER
ncbi:MAG: hypothetical protein IPO18_07205 [bacterium]|nr:hypothetical protein [bacterium]MBK7771923.1 hypothetical protein [bacterium]MBK9472060.1 hypothetical protein [bacterium]